MSPNKLLFATQEKVSLGFSRVVASVMSLFKVMSNLTQNGAPSLRRKSESSDDEEKRLKRREKNRVAAQRSRRRQTRRADELHEAYECLEQENSLLKKEVQLLIEEQQRLTEALKAHEPSCPVLNCGMTPTTRCTVPHEFV